MTLVIAIILLLNFISSFIFTRFDLTTEKKYSLNEKTKELLQSLDDVVFFKVYLEGEFPPEFDKLRNATKEMLDEFRAYSNNNIEYEFINPSEEVGKKEQNTVYKQLYEKGLQPTFLEINDKAGNSQQVIFPGALVTYANSEIPIQLFQDQMGLPTEVILNNSVEALEYELANAIYKLKTPLRQRIAFIEGHGELDSIQSADFQNVLSEYYDINRVAITGKFNDLEKIKDCKAIIISKPDSFFNEQSKFIIDQYIMNGGNVLWLIDNISASMDSLQQMPMTFGLGKKLNLDDMLFKYGVRINYNLVQDLKCGMIPLPINNQYKLMPWYFFPLPSQGSNHPIVKNMNVVRTEFCSSIDTIVTTIPIKKTILLSSSKYASTQIAPVRIDLRMASAPPNQKLFKNTNLPLAVLLEGDFESVFKNRIKPKTDSSRIDFIENGKTASMIVVGDGDVAKSFVKGGKAMPLGYDIWKQQTFGNKNFLLNCVNYLCDSKSGLMQLRTREVILRILDKKKVAEEKTKWQIINTAIPIAIVIAFGVVRSVNRKRKYTSR